MPLDFDHPPADPVPLFNEWLQDAARTFLPNPNAMTLATVNAQGQPSARIVLLRGFDERGAVFFTNRRSRKGEDLSHNGRAALLFHWDPLDRQIRIEGTVSLTSDEESDSYFAGRHRQSQINAWASAQSHPVASRAEMLSAQAAQERRFEGQVVPRPPVWGGYRVGLERIEFWQGDPYRFHDRVVYQRVGSDWKTQRLNP